MKESALSHPTVYKYMCNICAIYVVLEMVTVHFAFVRFQHTAALGADAVAGDPARHILDIAEFARGSVYSVCNEMQGRCVRIPLLFVSLSDNFGTIPAQSYLL